MAIWGEHEVCGGFGRPGGIVGKVWRLEDECIIGIKK